MVFSTCRYRTRRYSDIVFRFSYIYFYRVWSPRLRNLIVNNDYPVLVRAHPLQPTTVFETNINRKSLENIDNDVEKYVIRAISRFGTVPQQRFKHVCLIQLTVAMKRI